MAQVTSTNRLVSAVFALGRSENQIGLFDLGVLIVDVLDQSDHLITAVVFVERIAFGFRHDGLGVRKYSRSAILGRYNTGRNSENEQVWRDVRQRKTTIRPTRFQWKTTQRLKSQRRQRTGWRATTNAERRLTVHKLHGSPLVVTR